MNEKKTYYGRPDTSPVSTVALSFIGQSSILFSRLDDLLSVWGEREEHSRDGEGPVDDGPLAFHTCCYASLGGCAQEPSGGVSSIGGVDSAVGSGFSNFTWPVGHDNIFTCGCLNH